MNGSSLIYKLRQALQESSTSSYMDAMTSYDYLYEAAKEYARRTKCLTKSTTITTVSGQAAYDLPADYLCLYITNTLNEFILQLNPTATETYWMTWCPYERIVMNNSQTDIPIPPSFSIIDKQDEITNISSTATAAGTSANGVCNLTDSTAPFANVAVGDRIYNTSDGSDGYIVVKTSPTVMVTALFNGTDNDWTSSDAYIIIPQPRKQIVLEPAPSVSGYTITVPYIQRPIPVYSPYASYRFDSGAEMALVYYACWLYKYRDRDPNYGDAMYKHWDNMCRRGTFDTKRAINQISWRFNLNKRSYKDRSMK